MKRIIIPLLSAISVQLSAFGQGSLTPPGAPTPTMKSLDQVEPRTPITSLPVTISVPGSYYVTTNLTGNPGGITIAASGVTVDLMGFELVGGSAAGVGVSGFRTNIVVRNGSVRNWSGSGVDCSTAINGQITGVTASRNGTGGGLAGIFAGEAFLVRECTAFTNVASGIRVTAGSMVEHCVARANGGDGLVSDYAGVTFRNNTATGNGGNGILANSNSLIIDNLCVANGFTSGTGAGINIGADNNRIDNNTVLGNRAGIRSPNGGDLIVRNNVRLNTSGNFILGVFTRIGPTNHLFDINGILTNQNPWANINY